MSGETPVRTERTIAPYGAWESPVTTEMLTAGALRFEGIAVDGDDVYWVESRPDEAGRCAAMRLAADGATTELTTPAHNARSRVHEYGGGALAVSNGVAYFSNFSDQRLYRRPVDGSEAPAAITPHIAVRYADATVDDARGRLLCVAENHRRAGAEAENAARVGAHRRGRAIAGSPRLRLLRLAAPQPRREPARVGLLEPPEHAVGRNGAVARGRGRRRQPRVAAPDRGRSFCLAEQHRQPRRGRR